MKPKNLELKIIVTEMKSWLENWKEDMSRQKKESVDLKKEKWKLLSLREKK
jgi:hypothetical protein